MDTLNAAILAILFIINGASCTDSDQIIQISKGELNTLKESLHRLERFAENQISLNQRLETELEDQRGHIEDLRNIISRQAEQIQQQEQQQQQLVKVQNKAASKNNGIVRFSALKKL